MTFTLLQLLGGIVSALMLGIGVAQLWLKWRSSKRDFDAERRKAVAAAVERVRAEYEEKSQISDRLVSIEHQLGELSRKFEEHDRDSLHQALRASARLHRHHLAGTIPPDTAHDLIVMEAI